MNKSVGEVEFRTFAVTVDPAIRTTCLHCPPDAACDQYCAWEFSLAPAPETRLKQGG
jgi:hypothetical protein